MYWENIREALQKFDPENDQNLQLLDVLLKHVYEGKPLERDEATKILLEFEDRPESLFLTPQIIARSNNDNTRFYMLNLLQKAIDLKWKAIPENQRPGIKAFVGQLAVEWSGIINTPLYMQSKVNETLISIMKYEWPENWPTLVAELLQLAQINEMQCRNVIKLFTSLAADITTNWDITHNRKEQLKIALIRDFEGIYNLCLFVFEAKLDGRTNDNELVNQSLECLQAFVPLIGLEPYRNKNFIRFVNEKFFSDLHFQKTCLKIYTTYVQEMPKDTALESTVIKGDRKPDLEEQIDILNQVNFWMLHKNKNTIEYDNREKVPMNSQRYWEEYYFHGAQFYSAVMQNLMSRWSEAERLYLTDMDGSGSAWFMEAVEQMMNMTEVSHEETRKVALDFWLKFVNFLRAVPHSRSISSVLDSGVLGRLTKYLVNNMYKPPGVYVKYDEDTGTIQRQWETDTDEVQGYNHMTQILYTLAAIAAPTVERVLYEELGKYTDKEEYRGDLSSWQWSPASFNKLCWAVGSISGAMPEEMEKKFLTKMILKLLHLCEHRTGRANKAIVASMTMYVVGNFPRFLKRLYAFMEAVIHKLFTFMDEDFMGVQEMAVETLLKLSKPLRMELSMVLTDGSVQSKNVPIGSSLTDVSITAALSRIGKIDNTQNLILLYEALATMNTGTKDSVHRIANYDKLVKPCLDYLNGIIKINEAPSWELVSQNRMTLAVNLKLLSVICEQAGVDFDRYLDAMCDGILTLYSTLSAMVQAEIDKNGINAAAYENVKSLRSCKKEILVLMSCYIKAVASHPEYRAAVVGRCQRVVIAVLKDYQQCNEACKDVEVLRFLKSIVENLEEAIIPHLPEMFQLVFQCTLMMISEDFHTNMDHRIAFYELLMTCTKNALEGILRLPADELKLYVECLAFGFRHEQPTIADLGLSITKKFLSTIITRSTANLQGDYHQLLQEFCKVLYKDIFRNIFAVTMDTLHKNGLDAQCEIVRMLIYIVASGLVESPVPDLCAWVSELVHMEFPNVPMPIIQGYFNEMLAKSDNVTAFRQPMSDLLIDSKRLHDLSNQ